MTEGIEETRARHSASQDLRMKGITWGGPAVAAPTTSAKHALETASAYLLHRHDLDEAILLKTLSAMSTSGSDYADLYFQSSHGEVWELREGIVRSATSSIDQGVGARTIYGDETRFAYSQALSVAALEQLAAATRGGMTAGRSPGAAKPSRFQGRHFPPIYAAGDPHHSAEASTKVALLERLERMARLADPRITQVTARLSGGYDIVLVARCDGCLAADIRPLVRLALEVTAEFGGAKEIGTSGAGGRFDYAYFTGELLASLAARAVDMALASLEARPAPAGTMDVVLGPGVPGVLLHEAVGHGLEGDFNRKGSSAFSGCVGQQVAARGVTVVDDGSMPHRRGSLRIDDEGNETRSTVLIEDGVLKGYMQDTLNARLMGVPVTGNARRASYAALPMPRMTNTYMASGSLDPREVIASVKKGLYVTDLNGGQVDITSGQFSMEASLAFLIEDGRITAPVKGATLIGNGPEVLRRISMIGNDAQIDAGIGVCGKAGQSVPVGLGQPTLKIDGMTVGGAS